MAQRQRRSTVERPHCHLGPKKHVIKMAIVGDYAVGKSSISSMFVLGDFSQSQQNTIGASFLQRDMHVNGNIVKVEIWDTAGQERYRSLVPNYYRQAHAAIVVYDLTNLESFENAVMWVNELKEAIPHAAIGLSGNKSDLVRYRKVKREVAEEYAKENGLIFAETSAKTGLNIQKLFSSVAERAPKELPVEEEEKSKRKRRRSLYVRGGHPQSSDSQRGCCKSS